MALRFGPVSSKTAPLSTVIAPPKMVLDDHTLTLFQVQLLHKGAAGAGCAGRAGRHAAVGLGRSVLAGPVGG